MKKAEIRTLCTSHTEKCPTNAEWEIADPTGQYASAFACTPHRAAVTLWFERVTGIVPESLELT